MHEACFPIMPGPLPIELRQRVVNDYKENGGYQKVADRFAVSIMSVRRWVKLDKETQSLKHKPYRGCHHPSIRPEQLEDLAKISAENLDATLEELADIWNAKNKTKIHASSIWRGLKKANITFKKNFFGDRAQSRRRHRENQRISGANQAHSS
jgi:transposase